MQNLRQPLKYNKGNKQILDLYICFYFLIFLGLSSCDSPFLLIKQ